MVDRINSSPQSLQMSPMEQATQPSIVGQLHGQEVIEEKDIASLVHDSLEEVGFEISEQMKSVDVQEVVVEDLAARIEERIKKLTRLKDQVESTRGQLDPAKLSKLLKALQQGGKPSGEDVRKGVAEQLADVTDQYAALDDLKEQLGHRAGHALLRKQAAQGRHHVQGHVRVRALVHRQPARGVQRPEVDHALADPARQHLLPDPGGDVHQLFPFRGPHLDTRPHVRPPAQGEIPS